VLAVPNFSAGRDHETVAAIRGALEGHSEVLDIHADAVHDRSVFSLAGEADALVSALAAGAAVAVELIDMSGYAGAHPAVGSLDVAPLVWLSAGERSAAEAAARRAGEAVARQGIPVFLYGELASGEERRERAFVRRGGLAELSRRLQAGEIAPDMGPASPHPTAGATLVTARPPLAAFNLVVEGLDADAAQGIAAAVREGGGGPAGLRAIAIDLGAGRRQISTNVHDPLELPLAMVVELVRALAGRAGGDVVAAEIVGLVPEAALAGFPADLPVAGFDPARRVIERRLAS